MRVFEYNGLAAHEDPDSGGMVREIENRVRFELSPDVFLEVFPAKDDSNAVEIRLSAHRGPSGLKVLPHSGNVFLVKQDIDVLPIESVINVTVPIADVMELTFIVSGQSHVKRCNATDKVFDVAIAKELKQSGPRPIAPQTAPDPQAAGKKLFDSRDYTDDYPWMEVTEVGHGKIVLDRATENTGNRITIETRDHKLEQVFAKHLYSYVQVRIESDPSLDESDQAAEQA